MKKFKPSLWINSHFFIAGLMLMIAGFANEIVFLEAFGFVILVYKWLEIACTNYYISENDFGYVVGIFNQYEKEYSLNRIRAIKVERPFLFRLVGIENIVISTNDIQEPDIVLTGIGRDENVHQLLRDWFSKYQSKNSKKLNIELY